MRGNSAEAIYFLYELALKGILRHSEFIPESLAPVKSIDPETSSG